MGHHQIDDGGSFAAHYRSDDLFFTRLDHEESDRSVKKTVPDVLK